jgi:hypothetical protein
LPAKGYLISPNSILGTERQKPGPIPPGGIIGIRGVMCPLFPQGAIRTEYFINTQLPDLLIVVKVGEIDQVSGLKNIGGEIVLTTVGHKTLPFGYIYLNARVEKPSSRVNFQQCYWSHPSFDPFFSPPKGLY